jgi:hypothetical protein
MTVQVLPTLKRFIEGTANMVFAPATDSRGRRAKDFMNQDLTGSARFYGR